MHHIDEPSCQGLKVFSLLIGSLDDLVIDVGDITHIGHLITEMPQIAGYNIKYDHDPRMPQVAVVIDRHTTDIHPHLAFLDGDKGLLPAGQGVIDLEHTEDPSGGVVNRGLRGYFPWRAHGNGKRIGNHPSLRACNSR